MSTTVLTVDKVNVFYGTSQALFGASLNLYAGETLALLGRNGAGKSTMMKAIAGIIPSRDGNITFMDKPIKGLAAYKIARSGMGYVPEDRQIFPTLTVQDNLEIAHKKGPEGQDAWPIERVYEMLPLLAPLKDRLGGQLSGGEQQMLTVGRSLMGNPTVLLLDEPSEGLAPIMVEKIGTLIETLKSLGSTIVLAEQNLHFCLGLADRAVVIDKGADVFHGTIAELNANDEVKERYLSV